MAFLALSVAAVGAGAFPELFFPAHITRGMTAPPALGALLAAQAIFIMVFCTLLLRGRAGRGLGAWVFETVGEYVLWLIVSIPLYVVAGWLSDATARDVVRGVLYLSAVAAGAWGLGLWVASGRPAMMAAAVLVALLAAAGLPVVHYLAAELADSPSALAWLRQAAPATCAFDLVSARAETWRPGPAWAWALWPVVGLMAAFGGALVRPGEEGQVQF